MAHLSSSRTYREALRPADGETAFQVVVEQTDLFIVAARDLSGPAADLAREARAAVKNAIALYPGFAESLSPVPLPERCPEIVRRMIEGARLCGVGPMAAVAGAVAQHVGEGLAGESPEILVENGGDVFLASARERVVALLAEPESGARLGVRLPAGGFPCGLCASSGRIGHSLSLGSGDLVAVLADTAPLADAAATALANLLRRKADLTRVTDGAKRLSDETGGRIRGVFAQMDDGLAAWGEMELVAV